MGLKCMGLHPALPKGVMNLAGTLGFAGKARRTDKQLKLKRSSSPVNRWNLAFIEMSKCYTISNVNSLQQSTTDTQPWFPILEWKLVIFKRKFWASKMEQEKKHLPGCGKWFVHILFKICGPQKKIFVHLAIGRKQRQNRLFIHGFLMHCWNDGTALCGNAKKPTGASPWPHSWNTNARDTKPGKIGFANFVAKP